VQRTASGGLGIEVDPETNVVASNLGQPALKVGDLIVAVDGEACGTRYIGALLKPGADKYTLSVERGTAAGRTALEGITERFLTQAASEAKAACIPLAGVGLDAVVSAKILGLVEALEAAGSPANASAADIAGFWRLRFTDDRRLGGGMSGFGLVPGCTATAQFQLYGQPKPESVQCVEVIANQQAGSNQVAGLKGKVEVASDAPEAQAQGQAGKKEGGPTGPVISDVYTRIELEGTPQTDSGTQRYDYTLTFLGETLRICRAAAGKDAPAQGAKDAPPPAGYVRVYEKLGSERAQSDLAALVAARVEVDKAAAMRDRWQAADDQRRRSSSWGGGGGGGGGPMPEPSSGRS
jgi:hypothetical protein